jgi:hypothetical protein
MIAIRFPAKAVIFLFATTSDLALGYFRLIDTAGCLS